MGKRRFGGRPNGKVIVKCPSCGSREVRFQKRVKRYYCRRCGWEGTWKNVVLRKGSPDGHV